MRWNIWTKAKLHGGEYVQRRATETGDRDHGALGHGKRGAAYAVRGFQGQLWQVLLRPLNVLRQTPFLNVSPGHAYPLFLQVVFMHL